jgi:putative Mg2+ transporter-C (MgtC) family protein
MTLPVADQLLRLVLAAVLGAIIGVERERRDYAAGLRTHALVSLGAALAMIVSAYGFKAVVGQAGVALDPSRVAAQVVSGVGFLGAGTIIVQRATVRGLTTAASIWVVAGIGLACGAGLYIAALLSTALALIVLVPLKAAERRYLHRPQPGLELRLRHGAIAITTIESEVRDAGLEVRSLRLVPDRDGKSDRLNIEFESAIGDGITELVDRLRALDGVERLILRPPRGT